jgi:hypothetical protein
MGPYVLHEQPGLRALLVGAFVWRDRVVGSIIRQGSDRGEFRECNASHITRLFFGMLAPFVLYHRIADPDAAHRSYARSEAESIGHTALDVFMNGLRQVGGREAPICHRRGSV